LSNCPAKADVVRRGSTGGREAPLRTFSSSRSTRDLPTFSESLPVLDTAEDWEFDVVGCLRPRRRRVESAKKYRATTSVEATKEQSAQVEMYMEDGWVGTLTTTKVLGARSLAAARERECWSAVGAKLADAVNVGA